MLGCSFHLRERALLAHERAAARGNRPQHQVVDRGAVGCGAIGQHATEVDADGNDARRVSLALQPGGRARDRLEPGVEQGRIVRSAGAVAGAGQVDPQHGVTGARERQRPRAPGAIGAELVVAEQRQQQHRRGLRLRRRVRLVVEREDRLWAGGEVEGARAHDSPVGSRTSISFVIGKVVSND